LYKFQDISIIRYSLIKELLNPNEHFAVYNNITCAGL